MKFLEKKYGLNDYNMPILPYRMMGEMEYSNDDIIDLNDKEMRILTNIFKDDYEVRKICTKNEEYSIVDKKLVMSEKKYSSYLEKTFNRLIDEDGKLLSKDYINIYFFNDNKYGADLNYNRTYRKMNICEDFDGLLKYLYDIGVQINEKDLLL